MGLYKAEKSMSPKVRVGPAKMIVAMADAMQPLTLAQYAPKAPPNPFVDGSKGGFMTVLEVFKPALQSAVNIGNNLSQATAVAAPRFGSNGIFELLQAFLARPSSALHKVVAEKVKHLSGNAYVNK